MQQLPQITDNITTQFCYSMNEWLAMQAQFKDVAMQFGYFCLVCGICGGLFIGWQLAKRKYAKE